MGTGMRTMNKDDMWKAFFALIIFISLILICVITSRTSLLGEAKKAGKGLMVGSRYR
jgi:hypothetical protein